MLFGNFFHNSQSVPSLRFPVVVLSKPILLPQNLNPTVPVSFPSTRNSKPFNKSCLFVLSLILQLYCIHLFICLSFCPLLWNFPFPQSKAHVNPSTFPGPSQVTWYISIIFISLFFCFIIFPSSRFSSSELKYPHIFLLKNIYVKV